MYWFMWEEQNVILSGLALVVLWFVSKGLIKKKTTKSNSKVDDNF